MLPIANWRACENKDKSDWRTTAEAEIINSYVFLKSKLNPVSKIRKIVPV